MQALRVAIVGLGVAGRARLRAAAQIPEVEVGAVVSRRGRAALDGLDASLPAMSFEAALRCAHLDAFVISTENTDHERKVRAALGAGKHVLCEYPLAVRGDAARSLIGLAESADRVLHVGYLSLLSPAHAEARRALAELGPLIDGRFTFTAGYSAALAEAARQGPAALIANARLVQVLDLFGPAEFRNAEVETASQGTASSEPGRSDAREPHFSLEADLEFRRGGRLHFVERRASGLPRRRELFARCVGGPLEWSVGGRPRGLFAADLARFADRVLRGTPDYVETDLMLDVLDFLERLSG